MTTKLAVRKRLDARYPSVDWNFWLHVTEGMFATLSGILVNEGIVLAVLVGALGGKPTMLGMITAVSGLAFLVPIFAASKVEAYPRKKKLVMLLGIGQRLPLLLTAAALYFIAPFSVFACLMVIAVLRLFNAVIVQILVPPWMDLLADTIPDRRKSRLFGYRFGISSVMGLVFGGACYAIVDKVAFPTNFSLLYLAGFFAMAVSWLLFALVDESPPSRLEPHSDGVPRHYLRELFSALKADKNFQRYLVYRALTRTGFAVGVFYAFTAVNRFNVSPALATGGFIIAQQSSSSLGNFLFPRVADKLGNKRTLAAGILLHVSAMLLAVTAKSGQWFFAIFAIAGAGGAAMAVAGMPFMLSLYPKGKRVGYTSLTSLVTAPVGMAAVFGAGQIFEIFNYRFLFACAAVVMLSALFVLERCRAPEPEVSSMEKQEK